MARKPLVVYVEDDDSPEPDTNFSREALDFVLRNDFGCLVMLFKQQDELKREAAQIKRHAQAQSLLIFIIKQARYLLEHEEMIAWIRGEISPSVPIAVMTENMAEEPFKGIAEDPQVYVFGDTGGRYEIMDLVNKLVSSRPKGDGWFGAETTHERLSLLELLPQARAIEGAPYSDRGDGTADLNSQTVAEALRMRLLPNETLGSEFEHALSRGPKRFPPFDEVIYGRETAFVKGMSTNQRRHFIENVRASFDQGISAGSKIYGFAIEPGTGEELITSGLGKHHRAVDMLRFRIESILLLRLKQVHRRVPPEERRASFVRGLIVTEVPNHPVPLLRLPEADNDLDARRKAAVLIKLRRCFIPIDTQGFLIE